MTTIIKLITSNKRVYLLIDNLVHRDVSYANDDELTEVTNEAKIEAFEYADGMPSVRILRINDPELEDIRTSKHFF